MIGGILLAAALAAGAEPVRPWRMVNLDNDFYFVYAKSPDDITERAFADYIDSVIGGGKVTHCCMCVCGQRTSYASKAWDPIWEGLNEPDQNGRTNNQWCVYAKLAHDRGLDPWAIWIRRCREKGVSAFVSMRMNDVHYTDQPVHFRHRRFWREHPEFRRIPGAVSEKGKPWNDYALDYTHPEVRNDAIAMVKEILRNWDADGLELDWMRFSLHLTRNHDAEGAWALTEFMRRVKALVVQAEKWRGHRIAVAVRVPSTWGSAQGLGYDVGTWAKEGLTDIVIPCNTYTCSDFDMDMDEWRQKIAEANPKVAVLPGTDICVSCDWRVKPYYLSQLPFFYGWCALYGRGNPDGFYLFNLPHAKELMPDVCGGDLSPETLARRPRRFPVTWHDNGLQSRNRNWRQLPRKFASPLRLKAYAAKSPTDMVAAVVVSFDVKDSPGSLSICLNGKLPVKPIERLGEFGIYGRNAGSAFRAEFAADALRNGENEIAIAGDERPDAEVVWAEISLAAVEEEVSIWPENRMPCKRENPEPESMSERSRDHVWIKYNVSTPTMTLFRARTDGSRSPALVVCPGGGYGSLAWNKEGTEVADWLNRNGYSAFVLKYRVPKNPDGAFCDIQRAMGVIRLKAAEFGVDANRLGVIGFSAGGNLAARLSCNFDARAYPEVDAADRQSCRPDFALLVYPWALVEGADEERNLPLKLRSQFAVTRSVPPTFLVQAVDDPFHVENALAYAAELKRADVGCELHVYPTGSHGFGLRAKKSPVSQWPGLAESWLRRLDVPSGEKREGMKR